VELEGGEYLIVAERGGEAAFLGVTAEGGPRSVYFLDHDARPRVAGRTLSDAIASEIPAERP
jgi:hypothetical protein